MKKPLIRAVVFYVVYSISLGGFLIIPVNDDCHNKSPKKKSDDVAWIHVSFKVLFHNNGLLGAK